MELISVNDKLPECYNQHKNDYSSGLVLGYTNHGDYVITQLWNNKEWDVDDDEIITHWFPLPRLPKTN